MITSKQLTLCKIFSNGKTAINKWPMKYKWQRWVYSQSHYCSCIHNSRIGDVDDLPDMRIDASSPGPRVTFNIQDPVNNKTSWMNLRHWWQRCCAADLTALVPTQAPDTLFQPCQSSRCCQSRHFSALCHFLIEYSSSHPPSVCLLVLHATQCLHWYCDMTTCGHERDLIGVCFCFLFFFFLFILDEFIFFEIILLFIWR